jgi:probable HAF family extracellular repeat protein
MRRLGIVLVVLALSSGTVASAGAVGRRGDVITVVEVSRARSSAPADLSERGHVVFTEEATTGAADFRAVRWHRGRTTDLTPDDWDENTSPTAVNRRGQVTGSRWSDAGGFVWSHGTLTTLRGAPGTVVAATDIDDRGRILVGERPVDGFTWRAAIIDGNRKITSPLLPDGDTMNPVAINNHHEVVGGAINAPTAYLWRVGRQPVELRPPGAYKSQALEINERGSVLVVSVNELGFEQLFLWRRGRLTDLGNLGGRTGYVYPLRAQAADQLNEHDQVAASSETASGEVHAFLWSDGEMRDLGTLGGAESRAHGINDRGEVVGESQTASGETHAFLWRDGVMTDIGTMFENPDQSYAVAINDAGQIAGVRYFYTPEYRDERVVLWETRGR